MSFSISFFARDVHDARNKLQDAHAPHGVKALIELAIAGISIDRRADSVGNGGAGTSSSSNQASASINRGQPAPPRLAGILVETHGHIDEGGGRSGIGLFRVEPYYT